MTERWSHLLNSLMYMHSQQGNKFTYILLRGYVYYNTINYEQELHIIVPIFVLSHNCKAAQMYFYSIKEN